MKNITVIKNEFSNCGIKGLGEFIAMYAADERAGVIKLVKSAKKKLSDYEKELKRVDEMRTYEKKYAEFDYICGIDEVGRGPLAGPVVSAAVVLPKDCIIPYINDSKKLTSAKREELYNIIMSTAVSVGFGSSDNDRIDGINILQATFEAMKKALSSLTVNADIIFVDGNQKIPGIDTRQISIVRGDAKSISVAAASIVAKVVRDRYMEEVHKTYPMYDFASNKGYGSAKHYEGLRRFGICPLHRKTFVHL